MVTGGDNEDGETSRHLSLDWSETVSQDLLKLETEKMDGRSGLESDRSLLLLLILSPIRKEGLEE